MSDRTPEDSRLYSSIFAKVLIGVMYLGLMIFCFYSPLLLDLIRPSKTLNICAFTETFCPQAIERFEKMTGVKVNLTYVELDEQIHAKFKINGGQGYDVINISDFMVQILAGQGMLEPMNHEKITNLGRLNNFLLDQLYDRGNRYSVPHKWFMYGIVYDKNFFAKQKGGMSLDFVFQDPKKLCQQGMVKDPYKLCMLDSPIDSFFVAALYLFGHADNLSCEQCNQVQRLLVEQKEWVECYTLYTVEYFLFTGIVPIALTSSSFARKILQVSDQFEFAIPSNGGILVIENLAIPARSKNKELAYQFINFMLSDEIADLNSSTYGWASSNAKAGLIKNQWRDKGEHLFPDEHVFSRLHIPLFSPTMRTKIDDIWLEVGFA